jgi:hypothetical protein
MIYAKSPVLCSRREIAPYSHGNRAGVDPGGDDRNQAGGYNFPQNFAFRDRHKL